MPPLDPALDSGNNSSSRSRCPIPEEPSHRETGRRPRGNAPRRSPRRGAASRRGRGQSSRLEREGGGVGRERASRRVGRGGRRVAPRGISSCPDERPDRPTAASSARDVATTSKSEAFTSRLRSLPRVRHARDPGVLSRASARAVDPSARVFFAWHASGAPRLGGRYSPERSAARRTARSPSSIRFTPRRTAFAAGARGAISGGETVGSSVTARGVEDATIGFAPTSPGDPGACYTRTRAWGLSSLVAETVLPVAAGRVKGGPPKTRVAGGATERGQRPPVSAVPHHPLVARPAGALHPARDASRDILGSRHGRIDRRVPTKKTTDQQTVDEWREATRVDGDQKGKKAPLRALRFPARSLSASSASKLPPSAVRLRWRVARRCGWLGARRPGVRVPRVAPAVSRAPSPRPRQRDLLRGARANAVIAASAESALPIARWTVLERRGARVRRASPACARSGRTPTRRARARSSWTSRARREGRRRSRARRRARSRDDHGVRRPDHRSRSASATRAGTRSTGVPRGCGSPRTWTPSTSPRRRCDRPASSSPSPSRRRGPSRRDWSTITRPRRFFGGFPSRRSRPTSRTWPCPPPGLAAAL